MIVGLIPARGGSKGIPRKNLHAIAGMPLLYWTIQAARNSELLDDFYVSTEDAEIAETARKFGAKVLLRPAHLATDEATTIALAMDFVARVPCDEVMVLQPTSPVRHNGWLDECIRDYRFGDYDTLATGYVTKIREYGTHQNLRRQDIKGFFYDDGNVYILDRKVIESGRWSGDKICRKSSPRDIQFEIDDPIDLCAVERLLERKIARGEQTTDLQDRLRKIRILITDVDGVLTDGGMYYDEQGNELKKFQAQDGMGFELVRRLGIKLAFVTGENTQAVERRAKKLKVAYLYQGCRDKVTAIEEILTKEQLTWEEVAYIGDDLLDLGPIERAGLPVTVANGRPENKAKAIYVTRAHGGSGAARELCDLIAAAHAR